MEDGKSQANNNPCAENVSNPGAEMALSWSGKRFRCTASTASKGEREPVEDGSKDQAIQAKDQGSAADEIEQSELRGAGAFDLLKFEFVRPNNDGPPNKLIEQNDDGNHCRDAPKNRARVAVAGGSLEKGTEAGKTEVALPEHEHLASHQKKPAAGHGHHGVPNEPDRGKWEVQFGEALPAAETVDFRGFVELARDGFQRGIKTEGYIPGLSRENEQDGTEFDPQLTVRKKGDHGEHDAGQKAQHRNRLEDVQQRNHDDFGAAGAGGDVTKCESENEAEHIGDADAHQRVKRVKRKHTGILGNPRLRMGGTKPGTADGIDPKNRGEHEQKNGDIDQESPGPPRTGRPLYRGRERRCRGSGMSEGLHGRVRSRWGSACRLPRRNRK